jgi:hypothetical protein
MYAMVVVLASWKGPPKKPVWEYPKPRSILGEDSLMHAFSIPSLALAAK